MSIEQITIGGKELFGKKVRKRCYMSRSKQTLRQNRQRSGTD